MWITVDVWKGWNEVCVSNVKGPRLFEIYPAHHCVCIFEAKSVDDSWDGRSDKMVPGISFCLSCNLVVIWLYFVLKFHTFLFTKGFTRHQVD